MARRRRGGKRRGGKAPVRTTMNNAMRAMGKGRGGKSRY